MEQLLAVLLGAVASYLQGKSSMSGELKFFLSLVAAGVAGFAVTALDLYMSGTYDPQELLANIGVAFAASQTYYQTYLKKKNEV